MSNFGHEINAIVASRLMMEKIYSLYAGWDFCGYVWWDRDADTYKCEVWQWNAPCEIVSGSLPEIMDQVCDTYGDD